jgi:tetratricopeptide (TPR) repeat protein
MADDASAWGGPNSAYAYRAFISYSHRDKPFAARLHKTLEGYRIPKKLVGTTTPVGVVPRRLTPIFRDREELPASADLGGELSAAIRGSMFLVLICSPGGAKSKWVEQEIIQFKRAHGEARVLALIIDGTPWASDIPGREDEECFPRPLRYRLGPDGEVSDVRAEPIAADMRPEADGKRLAQLKLMAGLTGLKLDQLVQRETQRRIQQMTMVAAGAVGGMVITGGLALYANDQRIEANRQRVVAEREAKAARAASDYLVNTFELSNPATENPRTITALTILGRSADRARQELRDQPAIQARLLTTLARAYNNLGLLSEAQASVESSMPAIRKAGADGAETLLMLAETYSKQGSLDAAMTAVGQAERQLGPDTKKYAQQRGLIALTRGRILTLESKVDDGLAQYQVAGRYLEGDKDTPTDTLARFYANHGLLLGDAQRFPEADVALTKALSIRRRTLGEDHVKTASAWAALAQNTYAAATASSPYDRAKLRAAEMQNGNALRIQRMVLEGDNPVLADTISLQGQILADEGRLPEAERYLHDAVAMFRRAFGKPHSKIGIAEIYLAQIQSDQGRTAAALATLADAKHNYDVSYGKIHPNHGDLLVYRAKFLAKAGRMAEARADCAAGLKILRDTLGADAGFTQANEAKCAAIAPPAGLQTAALTAVKPAR